MMRTIILMIATLMGLAAQAYEPLIREDRVWEYCQSEIFAGEPVSHNILCFKFDGTQTVNDKTYHRLVSWVADDENKNLTAIALMRETNDGRVYILLQQNELAIHYNANYFETDEKPIKLSVQDNTEICLYDFSDIHNDSKCSTIAVMSEGSPLEYTASSLSMIPFLSDRKTVVRGSKEYKLTQYSRDESYFAERIDNVPHDWAFRIGVVEGIGNIGLGYIHLPYVYTLMTSGTMDEAYFVRQTDLAGNVIFDVSWLSGTNGVNSVSSSIEQTSGKAYDLTGKEVENPEFGTIYIRDGKKQIAR